MSTEGSTVTAGDAPVQETGNEIRVGEGVAGP